MKDFASIVPIVAVPNSSEVACNSPIADLEFELVPSPSPSLSASDEKMVAFMTGALRDTNWGSPDPEVHSDVQDAVKWSADRSVAQIIAERESVIRELELRAKCLRASGECLDWFRGCDAATVGVAGGVCGPLLESLAKQTAYHDPDCTELCRTGGALLGKLPFAGNGREKDFPAHDSVALLADDCESRNLQVLKKLKEDRNASALWELTKADVGLHRMTDIRLVREVDLRTVLLAPRFAVEQGVRDDGSAKFRAVDDETRSGVNSCCQPSERLRNDGLDMIFEVLRLFVFLVGDVPHLWKADIDSAYRRIPVRSCDRWAAHIVFMLNGMTFVAGHLAMPFGAVASVHAWDRVGAFFCHLARRLLHMPLMRYVDDYFSPERSACARHAMHCFARLVRCLLGPSAISDKKLDSGMPLDVLGLTLSVSKQGITAWPTPDKIVKWITRIVEALRLDRLTAGDASKLAGALNWAAQCTFHRLGRAMLQPLRAQKHCRNSSLSPALRLCLEWWLQVFKLELRETRSWQVSVKSVVHIFADARSTPPRLAAVVVVDGLSYFTDWEPPRSLMALFESRSDNQIMGLELLAIALGMSTFAHHCRGRRVCFWSDNAGSEHCTRKGSAKTWDHTCIVHCLWLLAAELNMDMQIERVPTSENVADLPSREEYGLLRQLGSKFVQPHLEPSFWKPSAWSALSLVGRRRLVRLPFVFVPYALPLWASFVQDGTVWRADVAKDVERAGSAPLGAFVLTLVFLGHDACNLFVHRDILLTTQRL